jgi:hypothetical protein
MVFCDVVDQYIHDFLMFLNHDELFDDAKRMRLAFAKKTCGRAFNRVTIALGITYSIVRTVEWIKFRDATQMLGLCTLSEYYGGRWHYKNTNRLEVGVSILRHFGFDNRKSWIGLHKGED